MPGDDEKLERAIANFSRAAIGGGLFVGLPVVVLVALDAPSWLTFGYLVVLVLVLTAYVIRRRRLSRGQVP